MQITDPDCYTLVTNGEVSSTTSNFTTKLPSTFTRITSEAPDFVQEQIKKELIILPYSVRNTKIKLLQRFCFIIKDFD